MRFDIINIGEFSGRKTQIYSVMYEGDELTLIDHFFNDYIDEYRAELEAIAYKLHTMGNYTGCRAQFFRLNEGAFADGVVALRQNRIRLYCMRYDSTCIFVGSGGYKPPDVRAYQEDPMLNSKAQEMRDIASCINKAIRDKDLVVRDDGTLDMSDFIDLEV